MKKANIIHIVICLMISLASLGQNKSVGIGTLSPNPSAALHVESTNQGFMMPHLTNPQITAIASPMNGLIVYSTTDSCYWFFKANHWDKICGTQHIVNNYLHTDTLIADSAYINILNVDSIIANHITTNYLNADTLLIDSVPIGTYVTNIVDTLAWLLNGNDSIKPTNFIGPKNAADFVVKTTNTERMRVLAGGNIGINTNAPTNNLDINGGFRMRPGATLNWLMLSDALGNGTWQNPTTILTTGNLNGGAWTILGNTATNPSVNFCGTKDSVDFVVRTNNIERLRVLANAGYVGINTNAPTNNLDINGGIRIRPGATFGYVLISDAAGNGTWQNPYTALSGSFWKLGGNTLVNQSTQWFGSTNTSVYMKATNAKNRMSAKGNWLLNDNWATGEANLIGSILTGSNNTFTGTANQLFNKCLIVGDSNNIAINNTNGRANVNSAVTIIGGKNVLSQMSDNNWVEMSVPSFILGSNNYGPATGAPFAATYIFGNSIKCNGGFGNDFEYSYMFGNGYSMNNCISSFVFNASSNTNATNPFPQANFGGLRSDVVFSTANQTGGTMSVPSPFQQLMCNVMPNGYYFYTNAAQTTGVQVAPGGGSWTFLSDETLKENITGISEKDVLKKLMSVPVSEWSYISQHPDTLNKFKKQPIHIGPMAQKFNSTFGYGEYDTMITASDMDGVLFASVRALAEKTQEIDLLKADIAALKKELSNATSTNNTQETDSVKAELESLKKQVAELKELLKK